ncbi:ribonuclease HII [Patescibacteria group bacterium]|nr:ribonuclease HII [Patescibacteria group bacterium]MBU2259766.1 ribonuclease HII [Patescibacteria group bacterium]
MKTVAEKLAVIVGIDEAGRGSLAGPVVAGACILPSDRELPHLIKDSKRLSHEEREEMFTWITQYCTYGCGIVDAQDIDQFRILSATEFAMQAAVERVARLITPTYLLIDGRDKFWFDYPHSSIIDGDEKEPCISAASIVAKVVRDRIMMTYDKMYPQYGFCFHKGYGTEQHFDLIKSRGLCEIHRKTFIRETTLLCAK